MDPLQVGGLAAVGVVAGLVLLARGMRGYLDAALIGGTATSPIESLAAGEVRVSGTVEPAEVVLVSPLQSRPCVWYRASVVESHGRAGSERLLDEERAVGFRVTDGTGTIRVFPRDGRFDAPDALHAADGLFGGDPPELEIRHGPAIDLAETDRATLVARLTTVQHPETDEPGRLSDSRAGVRHYREARIAPGDVVTLVGSAVPFGELGDPDLADTAAGSFGGAGGTGGADDPEIAADLAEARADGVLAPSPDAAWGNAAIEGFGIGRPVRAPTLDPDARPEPAVPVDAVASGGSAPTSRTWDLSADTLVVAAAPGVVSCAGLVAGRGVVSIDHGGGVISAIEPVETSVAQGTPIAAGETIGVVSSGGHCDARCVHFGVRIDGEYVSPFLFLGGLPRAVLLPMG
jgi:hypothetical protein